MTDPSVTEFPGLAVAPEPDSSSLIEQEPLRYRMLTGPDDRSFCERVSEALAQGYVLHGSPTMAFNGENIIVGQAVVLPEQPTQIPPLRSFG